MFYVLNNWSLNWILPNEWTLLNYKITNLKHRKFWELILQSNRNKVIRGLNFWLGILFSLQSHGYSFQLAEHGIIAIIIGKKCSFYHHRIKVCLLWRLFQNIQYLLFLQFINWFSFHYRLQWRSRREETITETATDGTHVYVLHPFLQSNFTKDIYLSLYFNVWVRRVLVTQRVMRYYQNYNIIIVS